MILTKKQREDIQRVVSIVAFLWHVNEPTRAVDVIEWALAGGLDRPIREEPG